MPQHERDALNVLADSYQAFAEILTGIASSEKKEWALSIGYLLQRVRGGHFVKTLLDEIQRYREKGKIKDGYLSSEQSFSCLQELLDAIDKDSPDEVRFSAMKAIFLTAATETMSSRNDPLPQQLMQICRSLSSTDILILSASHKISSGELVQAAKSRGTGGGTTHVWIEHVLKHTGLRFSEIVRLREGPLMEKRLLSPHIYPDGSGFALTNHFRLTELGFHLCNFIAAAEVDPNR